jgi:SOS-response transcriptional repressor LexA
MIATRKTTVRPEQVYDYIRQEMLETGMSPSLQAIADRFGLSGQNAAGAVVRALVRKGKLRRVHVGNMVRFVPVVPEGCCPCCARMLEQ